MHHYIITGASKGIGKEIALAASSDNAYLHLIARSQMNRLEEEVRKRGAGVRSYRFDLTDTGKLDMLMDTVFAHIGSDTEIITLINNAGMLAPIGPVGKYGSEAFRINLELNYVSPLLMTHIFSARTVSFKGKRRVVMITSGAAEHPLPGMSHYCSAKAGLNQFLRTMAAEQKDVQNPIRGVAFNPGKTDTSMQDEIRRSSREDFQYLPEFVRAKNEGELRDPAEVAGKLVGLITGDHFENGAVVNVADL